VHKVVANWRSAPLSAADKALCAFAEKVTLRNEASTPNDLDALRAHGLSDRAIHDATQVIAYFNYITRIADSLGVESEDFIQPWGQVESIDEN